MSKNQKNTASKDAPKITAPTVSEVLKGFAAALNNLSLPKGNYKYNTCIQVATGTYQNKNKLAEGDIRTGIIQIANSRKPQIKFEATDSTPAIALKVVLGMDIRHKTAKSGQGTGTSNPLYTG